MSDSVATGPHAVRVVENVFIDLADGARLAARLWLPADAERAPVPAILEYIPYRKRDFMRLRDEPMHHYVASHGYACARVDLRGSGDSSGVLDDEYLPREQEDAIEVIAWLAAQPWCDGNVGMTGISWGGFNALQVAAHAPPALGAIITLCASDDRFSDDAHYMGGALLNENQIWGTVLLSINALPPDPDLVGESWRDEWFARLEADRPFPANWLAHPDRDAYWKQGSVCEHPERIRCPVYAVGGWADGYSNAVPRLLASLTGPRKGLVGPWAHAFPHAAVPGPCIGYLDEAIRWWDRWLKGRENGIDAEPEYRVWMQTAVPPAPTVTERPGRWVAEDVWPSARIEAREWWLASTATLVDEAPSDLTPLPVCSPPSTGVAGAVWCEFGGEGESPFDQRIDDGRSLVFDSPPLDADMEILGAVVLDLDVEVDAPQAIIAVRLCDVAPDGTSLRVTLGALDLRHRNGHETSEALEPGTRYRMRFELNEIAHRFEAGQRVRLAISTAYWPMLWPSPTLATLKVHPGSSRIRVPVRPPRGDDARLAPFPPPRAAAHTSTVRELAPARVSRTVEHDLAGNEVVYRHRSVGGDLGDAAALRIEDIDLVLAHTTDREFRISDTDPLGAVTTIIERLALSRGEWRVRIEARTVTTADATSFRVQATLLAYEGDTEVFRRDWDERLARGGF